MSAARGRGRDSRQRGSSGTPTAAVTPATLLQDAETLQQRAERRSGQEALQAFQAATAKFREALQAGLAGDAATEAHFGLAECLQSWADLQRELLQQSPDEALMGGQQQQQHVQSVQQAVRDAYAAGLEAYKQVPSAAGSTTLRADAAVNAANVLCSLSELCQEQQEGGGSNRGQQEEVLGQLTQAVQLYQSALAQEEDAATLSNLADAQVALGEAALAAGQAAEGQAAFESALQSYQASCALNDSASGDDLPGLLHNWGAGLHTISKHATDLQLKQSLLDQAALRLRSSIQFSRADPAPHNALGDVLMDAAEVFTTNTNTGSSNNTCAGLLPPAQQQQQPQQPQPSGGGAPSSSSSRLPDDVAAHAAGLIKAAVDEGYMAALTINRTNADALVGLAEAGVAMAKLAWRQGDAAAAATHIADAVRQYSSALQRPDLLGDASERSDIRYNAACAAALAGQFEITQQLIQGLAAAGMLDVGEMAGDEDLASVRGLPWFVQLVQ